MKAKESLVLGKRQITFGRDKGKYAEKQEKQKKRQNNIMLFDKFILPLQNKV